MFDRLWRSFQVGLRIVGGILDLAPGVLDLSLCLLNSTFDLGPCVAGQVSNLALCAACNIVDRANHSILVHVSTLLRSSCSRIAAGDSIIRSEEHTSELQSLRHLVCRL